MKTLLFLCTGNYYRSRFAEILFNQLSDSHLDWRAESRGLALSSGNVGPISVYARDKLAELGIPIDETHFSQSV